MREYKQDDNQRAIIDFYGGQGVVLAAPGCGKTDVLSRRIVKAHEEYGVDYQDMLCITFTNRASREMKERIAETIGELPEKLYVGNLHRFCINFLVRNELIPIDTCLIDDKDQEEIIGQILGEKPAGYEIMRITKESCRIFEDANNIPQSIRLSGRNVIVSNSGKKYWQYKQDNSYIDFDDLLLLTYKIMSSPDYDRTKYELSTFKWIQVDEVQDLNPLQFAIIELLKSEEPTVLYLGDERQAIYGFIGADTSSLEHLKERYKNHIFSMKTNYRSPKYLLNMLNDYAVNVLKVSKDNLPIADKEYFLDDALMIVPCDNDTEQQDVMAVLARDLYFKAQNESVGVLVRNNQQAEALSKRLDNHKISHLTITKKDMFKKVDFKTIYSHFSVVTNDTKYSEWARILYQTRVIDTLNEARLRVSEMRELSLTPTDLINYSDSSYAIEFVKSIQDKEIVVFDTETTGLNVFEDDIIQIAAIKIKNGDIVPGSELDIIIETNKTIPETLKEGKENPMVKEYKLRKAGIKTEAYQRFMSPEDAFQFFISYVGNDELLGHNVNYDINILVNNIHRRTTISNFKVPAYWDTLKLSRLLDPNLRKHNLEDLLRIYNLVGVNSHNAIDDVKATFSLVTYCTQKLADKTQSQKTFLEDPEMKKIQKRFNNNYAPLYKHTMDKLYDACICKENTFDFELNYIYEELLAKEYINEMPMFNYMRKLFDKVVINHTEDKYFNQQLVNHIYEYRTFNETDLYQNKIIDEHVHIMTIHKSKGLEFDNVLVYDITDGNIPYSNSRNPIEDARVLYVAMSRAQKRVWITHIRNLSKFLQTPEVLNHFDTMLKGKKKKLLQFEESFVKFAQQN